IFPVVAAAGTVAVICEGVLTANAATVPLNFTALAPVKFNPVIETLAPAGPLAGENPSIRGATAKLEPLVAVFNGVVTLIGPVVAPTGTVAVILIAVFTV